MSSLPPELVALPAEPFEEPAPARLASRVLRRAFGSRGGEELAFFVSNGVVNLANFGFFVIAGRLFVPSDYGAISALLGLVTVANTPLNAVQAAVVQATVAATRAAAHRSMRRVVLTWSVIGLLLTAAVAAASPLVSSFFSLDRRSPVLVLALWFAPSVLSSAMCGALMGRFQFKAIAWANAIGAVARIVSEVGLGADHHRFGICGPVLATAFGMGVTAGLVLVALVRSEAWATGPPLRVERRHLASTLWCLGGLATLVAIDTLLARHLLPHDLGGSYAAAATAGKIAFYVSIAVPIVFYPRFAHAHEGGSNDRGELAIAALIVAALGVASAAVLAGLPDVIVDLLFGERYDPAQGLLGLLGTEGALLGLVGLLTYYHVAHHSRHGAWCWLGVATVTAVGFAAHPAAVGLARLVVAVTGALTLAMALPVLWSRRRRGERSP